MGIPGRESVLDASEVFGRRLHEHLSVLETVLQPRQSVLENRFLDRLRRLGYDPRERRALAAITPAAALTQAAKNIPAAFIEQAEYNGRRLAKLKVSPARTIRALQEFDRVVTPFVAVVTPDAQARFRHALEQWYSCVVLTLNNASYQVAEAEALAYQQLFSNELEAGSLDDLLGRMLVSLGRYCRADAGALFLGEQETSSLLLRATIPQTERTASRQVIALTPRLRRLLSKKRCVIAGRDKPALALCQDWAERFPTCWSIPLIAGGRLNGVLQFAFSSRYEWFPREVELLDAAGERCLMAAAKARLLEELASREAEVRQLAGNILEAEDRERKRISSELHDEAGQSLLCIRLQLEMLEHSLDPSSSGLRAGLREARALTEKTIAETRRLISALSPAVLEELGLGPALRQLATRLGRYTKTKVRLHMTCLDDVPPQIAGAAYRLLQECLNNVARHASASSVNISVISADEQLRMDVGDNGKGFRVEEALARQGSFGLSGMSERVALLGGKFRVESQLNRGTKVSIILPIRRETRD